MLPTGLGAYRTDGRFTSAPRGAATPPAGPPDMARKAFPVASQARKCIPVLQPGHVVAAEHSEEARPLAGVASRAGRVDKHQQHVGVAVETNLDDTLRVPTRGSFVPQLLARAAPEPGLARVERLRERLLVHPGD